jgi:outer membrane protein TolC
MAYSQMELSLTDAIRIGLERNYDIQIEKKRIEVAQNNNSWGEAGRFPKLDLNLTNNNSLTDNVEVALPISNRGKIRSTSLIPGVTLDWTLFNGFAVNISKDRLESLQKESEGNASIVISNTIQSIILGYYFAVLEKERMDVFTQNLKLSRDKYELLKVRKDLGSAVTSDLLLEEGNYLTDSTNLINQKLAYRNAVRNLNFLLAGDDPDQDYVFTDGLEYEYQNYDLDVLASKLENENIDLKKQYISQAITKYNYELSRSSRLPRLSFNAGFSDTRQWLDLSQATFFTGDGFESGPDVALKSTTRLYYTNFVISYTLFNGGKINRAIQNAIIQEDIANVQTERLKTSLYKDLADAYDSYNIRRQLYGINDRKLEAAQQNLEISQEKYKNGTISSFDFRTVQNNNLLAAITRLQSLYNLIDANITLMRLTGGIVETYQE